MLLDMERIDDLIGNLNGGRRGSRDEMGLAGKVGLGRGMMDIVKKEVTGR